MMPDSHNLEILPPDISAYRAGNTGVSYFTSFTAAEPGPHIAITAVTHGNELCGALALDYLFRHDIRPVRGRLSFGFVNVAAFLSFDPMQPTESRYVDEDFNRLWAEEVLDGPRDSVELRRAREIRPLIDEVDVLLDLHSMLTSVQPLMLAGPLAKGRRLAQSVGVPEIVVLDEGHAAGKRMRDYAGFGDPGSPKNALLMECGQHWVKASEAVAIETAFRFLLAQGVIDEATAAAHLPAAPPVPQRFIEVGEPITIVSDDFSFVSPFEGLEVIEKAGTIIAHDGGEEVRVPTDNCVLIMPAKQFRKGETAVRLGHYVEPEARR